MPMLIQRAETFIVNAQNPVARALVEQLVAEVRRQDQVIDALQGAMNPQDCADAMAELEKPLN